MKKMSLGLKIAGVAMGGFLVIGTVSWQMLKMGRERTAERLASKMESEGKKIETEADKNGTKADENKGG